MGGQVALDSRCMEIIHFIGMDSYTGPFSRSYDFYLYVLIHLNNFVPEIRAHPEGN